MLGAQEQVGRAFAVSAAPLVVTRISPQQIACWGERAFRKWQQHPFTNTMPIRMNGLLAK